MWQSRLETKCYVAILALQMAHARFHYYLAVSVVRLHVRLLAMCCPLEGLSFGLSSTMMSCAWTEKVV